MSAEALYAPPDRAIILDNSNCVYCGCELSDVVHTKEHVIGRRFVPKGSLANYWNLLVRACAPCNGIKADLENDISAITMYHEVWRLGDKADRTLRREANRKMQKSINRKTKKPIGESIEKFKATAKFPGGGLLTYSGTAPPQIESERVMALARLHIMGFFYWISYSKETRRGGFWKGDFWMLLEAARMDWGNDVHVGFMKAVVDWDIRVMAGGADGYFKVAIRRHPTEELWSWALEWNQSFRAVGFFGNVEAARQMVETLPKLQIYFVAEAPNRYWRYRPEKLLKEEDDILFQWEDTRLL